MVFKLLSFSEAGAQATPPPPDTALPQLLTLHAPVSSCPCSPQAPFWATPFLPSGASTPLHSPQGLSLCPHSHPPPYPCPSPQTWRAHTKPVMLAPKPVAPPSFQAPGCSSPTSSCQFWAAPDSPVLDPGGLCPRLYTSCCPAASQTRLPSHCTFSSHPPNFFP